MWARRCRPGRNPIRAFLFHLSRATCRPGKLSPTTNRRENPGFIPGDSGKCCSVDVGKCDLDLLQKRNAWAYRNVKRCSEKLRTKIRLRFWQNNLWPLCPRTGELSIAAATIKMKDVKSVPTVSTINNHVMSNLPKTAEVKSTPQRSARSNGNVQPETTDGVERKRFDDRKREQMRNRVVHPCGGTPETGQQKWDIIGSLIGSIDLPSIQIIKEMGGFSSKVDDVDKLSCLFLLQISRSCSERIRREEFKEGWRTEMAGGNIRHKFCTSSNAGSFGNGKSFVSVVKKINKESETEFVPSIVLDDECLNKKDLSMSLMGRVKEMASLANLKKWFSVFILPNGRVCFRGRLAWVEVGGVPFKLWTVKTFSRIASKWGDLMDVDEDELNYHSKRRENNIFEEGGRGKVTGTEFGVPSCEEVNKSEDPFVVQFEGNAMGDTRREGIYWKRKMMKLKWGPMDLNTVRSCWGNSIFEYVQSDSVGYSGEIKWGISEGDENVKFFHVFLTRAAEPNLRFEVSWQMGVWIDDPRIDNVLDGLYSLPSLTWVSQVGENMIEKLLGMKCVEKVLVSPAHPRWKLKTLSIGGRFTPSQGLVFRLYANLPYVHFLRVPWSWEMVEDYRFWLDNGNEDGVLKGDTVFSMVVIMENNLVGAFVVRQVTYGSWRMMDHFRLLRLSTEFSDKPFQEDEFVDKDGVKSVPYQGYVKDFSWWNVEYYGGIALRQSSWMSLRPYLLQKRDAWAYRIVRRCSRKLVRTRSVKIPAEVKALEGKKHIFQLHFCHGCKEGRADFILAVSLTSSLCHYARA
ncbi:hypothetical protein Tco_0551431 [Tanacetum coccineum]